MIKVYLNDRGDIEDERAELPSVDSKEVVKLPGRMHFSDSDTRCETDLEVMRPFGCHSQVSSLSTLDRFT